MALTLERAREVLRYEPDTGRLFWRIIPIHSQIMPGDEAGCVDSAGRIVVTLDGRPYKAHRLIWFIYFGYWPDEVDHRDRNPQNNRIKNLRDVTRMENGQNMGLFSSNKSGYNGVWQQPNGRWRARIKVMGKRISIGTFSTKEAAANAIEEYKNGPNSAMVV